MKNKKCFLCKEIKDIDSLIKREIGDKNKKERNVCPQCYENYINRKMFFEYFHEVLDIPKLDKTTVMILNSMGKTSSWEIMLHALKTKEKAIVDNIDKGFRYIIGILRNQILLSEREIRRSKKEKELQQYNIDKTSFPFNDLETEYKQKERLNISNLLD